MKSITRVWQATTTAHWQAALSGNILAQLILAAQRSRRYMISVMLLGFMHSVHEKGEPNQ